MLAPISWLKDYVDIDVTPEELESLLFSAGFEVEELIQPGKDISGVVVGLVTECEKIPDTHITVCKVDCGKSGVLQICCGADNVRPGRKFPVALPGATVLQTAKDHVTVEGVMTIKAGKLRGFDSCGMLCSGVEIALTEDLYPGAGYCGLLELPDDAPVGEDVKPLVGLDEAIFDISVTANRPDCQSIIGIAREVAAILKKPFRLPPLDHRESEKTLDFDVRVEAPDLCPRYMANFVSDVKIAPSPAWMRRRLALVGINAISNIVDITNYVLREFGQPMHAFDFSDLHDSIIVRRAKKGEKIVTLDEKEFTLTPDNLVICDGERPVALAGIMGGLNSEIKESTASVMFEAAKFARDNIRKTSRALGQVSDSSQRYEKGVDEYTTGLGMLRALNLIDTLGCGKVSSFGKDVLADKKLTEPSPLSVSIEKMTEILGIKVPEDVILEKLSYLGFSPEIKGDTLSMTVPPYRADIEGHVQDIAEEVIRLYGYEHIVPRFLDTAKVTSGGRTEEQKIRLKLKKALAAQGYSEAMFYSFFSPKDLDMLRLPDDAPERKAIKILNPISEDLSVMRTTLIPSAINACVRNIRRGNTEGRFFEMANVFMPDSLPLEKYPEEKRQLVIASFGDGEDFFTAKGAPEAIAASFGLEFSYVKAEYPFLHPGMCADIFLKDRKAGFIGKLSYEICEELSIEKPIFITYIDYAGLVPYLGEPIVYKPIPKFAAEKRDLALVADESITCGQIKDAIVSSCKYITSAELFDVYRSEKLGEDKKSMAFNIVFTPDDHEFTDDEIEKYIQKILKKLSYTLNISIR